VIIGGFFFTLFSTCASVLWVRNLSGANNDTSSNANQPVSTQATPAKFAKPFSLTLFRTLLSLASIFGLLTVGTIKQYPSSKWINPLQSMSLLFTTLSGFVFGANLPKSFTKIVHPLITCASTTWVVAKILAMLTGSTFLSMLKSYKCGTLAPLLAGAGDVLLFLLGPAVIALACQMYSRKKLMKENISTVGISTVVSAFGGLYGTAAMVRLFGIANPTMRLSLLPRNITSPLAMAIASMLGADVSLAVTIVVLTGLFGANFGASILDAAGVKDPVARGLGIGAAAHGLGTAAFAGKPHLRP
jgi:putative effector of murein hydrolase